MYDAEKIRANRLYYLGIGKCPRCGGANPVEPGRASCRECALKQADKRHQLRARRREEGLCTRCGKPLPEGSKYLQCDVCRAYIGTFRVFNKRRYEGLKEAGKCVKCGDWAEPGKTMCRKCLDMHIAYEKGNEALRENKRARRAGYRAAGLCIDCGEPVREEGHTRCKRCRDMRMDSTRKYRINKRIERQAKEARQNANHA